MQRLSKRLWAIAELVTPGSRIVDVGTDHAFLPIYLVQCGKIPLALAFDINEGPLSAARTHIGEAGLSDKIGTRRSDGLAALKPGEADSVVAAGMGGALMMRILSDWFSRTADGSRGSDGERKSAAPACGPAEDADLPPIREWILQPQSEIPRVREFLRRMGLVICDETMLKEDGKYYTVIRAVPEVYCGTEAGRADFFGAGMLPGQKEEFVRLCDAFGPTLLNKKDPVLKEWLIREQSIEKKILRSLLQADTEGAGIRRDEINEQLALIKEAVRLLETDD